MALRLGYKIRGKGHLRNGISLLVEKTQEFYRIRHLYWVILTQNPKEPNNTAKFCGKIFSLAPIV